MSDPSRQTNKLERGRRPEALAALLMGRIAEAMPVLPVPLVAQVLRDGRARSMAEITAAAEGIAPRDTGDLVQAGIVGMLTRKLIRETPEGYQMLPEQADAVHFYANSIAHLELSGSAAAQ